MTDRYVIVFQDGRVGKPLDKANSDWLCFPIWRFNEGYRPAYRIRIKEKARGHPMPPEFAAALDSYQSPHDWFCP